MPNIQIHNNRGICKLSHISASNTSPLPYQLPLSSLQHRAALPYREPASMPSLPPREPPELKRVKRIIRNASREELLLDRPHLDDLHADEH
jgi:hypothetical protein